MLRDSNFNASSPLRDDEIETYLEQFVGSQSTVRHYDSVVEVLESTEIIFKLSIILIKNIKQVCS